MNFATIGSIGAYTKAIKMQTQWKQKADSGNFAQKTRPGDMGQTSEADAIRQQLDQIRENNDMDLGTIYAKLQSGKRLSADELAYLKEKDPASYQKAKEIEAERARYEEELKKCKTKEDVKRLKTMQMSISMTKVNAIANDPAIPKAKKMELLMHENAKVIAVADVEKKFVESGRYEELPSEAERNEEIRENEERRYPEEVKTEEEVKPEEEIPEDEVPEEIKPEEGTASQDPAAEQAKPEKTQSVETPEAAATQEKTKTHRTRETVQESPRRSAGTFARAAYAKSVYKETMSLTDEEAFDGGKKTKAKKA